jgi:squalene-hopene/tetraprenyl-beta-curcumene cyclase
VRDPLWIILVSGFRMQAQRQVSAGDPLDRAVCESAAALKARQHDDGHWCFPLEADATIPAEYVLFLHYFGERQPDLERRIGIYLRAKQAEHGGWPLFHGGDLDISASVKAYFALKAIGDHPDLPHMVRARRAILARGGAARSNVFTRIMLAQWGQVPWRAVPVMPVEITLLPRWFFFHLEKVSYWSRTVIVPLLVLMAIKPKARNPLGVSIAELFTEPPEAVRNWHPEKPRSAWGHLFRALDRLLQVVEPYAPRGVRRPAIDRAVAFVDQRLNGEDGLGAIFPAMANAVMMYDALGVEADDPRVVVGKRALAKLVVEEGDRAWVQPCVSPVWDTALACHALMEAGADGADESMTRAAQWLVERQITEVAGDWAAQRPGLAPGGWAFQYDNAYYPDTDDTAVVVAALGRLDHGQYRQSIAQASEWLIGMQSKGGGWGAFDAENTHTELNHIPFADHGALLDPPTADVSARCVSALTLIGASQDHPAVRNGVGYLLEEQEADGSWFGRWGTNYVYGTWSALCALNAAGIDPASPPIRRAVTWLLSKQREDGGWGEDGRSYWDGQPRGAAKESTPSQTAWALLGLMAAGEVDNPAVGRGIDYLVRTRNEEGLWDEELYNAVGFPRVFYLLYHGYSAFFPVWALARYRNLTNGNSGRVVHAM